MDKDDMNRARPVSRLMPREDFGADARALMFSGLGADDHGEGICAGLEELSRHLRWLDEDYQSGQFHRLAARARSVVQLADQLGLRQIGQVAADVLYCLDGAEETALAATLSRLMRLMTMALDHAADPIPAV